MKREACNTHSVICGLWTPLAPDCNRTRDGWSIQRRCHYKYINIAAFPFISIFISEHHSHIHILICMLYPRLAMGKSGKMMNVMVMLVVVVITMSMCSQDVLGTRLSTLSEEGERMLRSCGDCRGYDPPKKPCCPPHPHALNTVSAPAMNTSFKQVSPVKYVEVTSEGRVLRSCGDCRGYDPPKEPCCPPHAMASATKLANWSQSSLPTRWIISFNVKP